MSHTLGVASTLTGKPGIIDEIQSICIRSGSHRQITSSRALPYLLGRYVRIADGITLEYMMVCVESSFYVSIPVGFVFSNQ